MEINSVLNMLTVIRNFQQCKPKNIKSNNLATIIVKLAFITALISISLLSLLVLSHTQYQPLNTILLNISYLLALISIISACVALITETISNSLYLFHFQEIGHLNLIQEIEHDQRYVKQLFKEPSEVLENTRYFLQQHCQRIQRRTGKIIGSHQITLISIIALGWTLSLKLIETIDKNIPINSFENITLFGFAALIGLNIGGMMLNSQVQKYTYQIEIIDMVLKQKK